MEGCPICGDDLSTTKRSIVTTICNHKFCRKCLSTYLTYRAKENRDFICPIPGCNIQLNPKGLVVKAILDARIHSDTVTRETITWNKRKVEYEKELEQYRDKIKDTLRDQLGKRMPGQCPITECDGLITNLRCDKCGIEICDKCGEKKHNGKCDETVMRDEFYITKVTKPCPICKTPIEKNKGCDHIHCVVCDSHFWWSTLEVFRQGNHTRAPIFWRQMERGSANEQDPILPPLPSDKIIKRCIQCNRTCPLMLQSQLCCACKPSKGRKFLCSVCR